MTSTSPPRLTLEFVMVDGWAPLAWVAIATAGLDVATVLHGHAVEAFPTWCAEAVWDGVFADGDLDKTDLMAGTGVRVRDGALWFVTSGDTLNRLQWQQIGSTTFVSNSLPALLAVTGSTPIEGFDYSRALTSIRRGLHSYEREVPTSSVPVHIAYYRNIVLREGRLVEVPKPSSTPDFPDFATYRDFLFDTARRFGVNARAPQRRHHTALVATMSSGYDSNAVAVIAREAGTREAFTIRRARRDASNLFSLDDSGAGVAAQLGLACTSVDRDRPEYPFEDSAWAAMGNVGEVTLSLFEYPKPVCLLFEGFMGDATWSLERSVGEPLERRGAPAGGRSTELRLELGVIACPSVYWGCARASQIRRLSSLPEMRPWTVGGSYDRPIPRRLLEEAGVKRGTFGTRKRVSSFNRRYAQPLSASLRNDFARFLRERGLQPGTRLGERMLLVGNFIDWVAGRHLPARLRVLPPDIGGLPPPTVFFLWGIERCLRRYSEALHPLAHALPAPVGRENVRN